ncbi:MAG: HAD family phosphatase [Planctomycetia bacterium]|nr:HAD family phosphatase [Planctomycetia bacterium]
MNTIKENRKGVIFDMDGVLVDSNPAHFESWVIAAKKEGVEFTRELFQRTFGQTSRAIVANNWPYPVTEADIARIDKYKEDLYRELAPGRVKAMPGAVELVQRLHREGYGVAVGSSGPAINVEFMVDLIGIRPYLDTIVSGTDVAEGKPSPAIFLTAANRMAIAPELCLIIDDSESGITAGARANMAVVGFYSSGHCDYEYELANLIIRDWSELPPERINELIDLHSAGE